VVRNQDKFAKRSKARRHATTAPVLRQATVALMLEARDRYGFFMLMYICMYVSTTQISSTFPFPPNKHARNRLKAALEAHPEAAHFTEATLPGSGANVTTRKSAEEGTFYTCLSDCCVIPNPGTEPSLTDLSID
jgi:hypothetical protein